MSKAPPFPDPIMELCGLSPVTSLAFGDITRKDFNSTLFSGHQDGKVLGWDLMSQRVWTSLESHTESVLWIENPQLDILITQGRDGTLKIWAHEQGEWQIIETMATAALLFCSCSLLSLGDLYHLFVPVEEASTVVSYLVLSDFTLKPNQSIQRFTPTPQQEFGMCMKICTFCDENNSPRLLVAYESGSLVLWDVTHCFILSKHQAHSESIMCLDICTTKDSEVHRAVTGSVDTEIKSWLISHDTIKVDQSRQLTNPGVSCVASRRDNRVVASGGWDGLCRVFTAAKLRPLAVLSHHKETVQCAVFSPTNKLAIGSKDGNISLWDVYADK